MAEQPSYEFFYAGAATALVPPEYGELFTGYRIPVGRIAAPTSIETADQIREVSARLSEGIKAVELQPISPEVFETIPKQHFVDIARLSKLTGAEISVHAPIIDPAGFTREGWSEAERDIAERHLLSVIERSHELNPKGNVPVTIHASALPGSEFAAAVGVPSGEVETYTIAVNRETGQMIPVKRERRFYPEEARERIMEPRETINRVINYSDWSSSLGQVAFYKSRADELLERSIPIIEQAAIVMAREKIKEEELPEETKRRLHAAEQEIGTANAFLSDVGAHLRSLFSRAYKVATPEQKAALEKISKEYREMLEKARTVKDISASYQFLLTSLSRRLPSAVPGERGPGYPLVYQPIEDFALEHASKTFGNIAFKTWQKFGDTSPMICIENMPVGYAFSRAEQIKKLIEESRKKFVEQAKAAGISEGKAKSAAEKIIGATWDMGHISMLRKGGFPEEKVIEETKAIAPYVKHVHVADNFGFTDSHLPPGMATMPTKEMLKEIEKKGFRGKAVVEAGTFVKYFRTSPTAYVLEALGSPLYAAYMQPFWNQIRATIGPYFLGYGTIFPEQHFSLYGAGFSGMPVDLGGELPKRRPMGAPME